MQQWCSRGEMKEKMGTDEIWYSVQTQSGPGMDMWGWEKSMLKRNPGCIENM